MSGEANPPVVSPTEDEPVAASRQGEQSKEGEGAESEGANGTNTNGKVNVDTVGSDTFATQDAPGEKKATQSADTTNAAEQSTSDDIANKPTTTQEDTEMKDDTKEGASADAEGSAEPTSGTSASANKPQARRKSGGVPEHKGKKLNKKASKAKLTHIDAKPGDYFYVRLKGYPLWPAIVCDESMLPNTLLKSRPVTAAREDGSYRPDFEDGGSKAKDRTFPVMYLHTNEFGWIPNYDLVEIDFEDVATVPANMRKDLAAARVLAAEQHDLEYFKDILKHFMEQKEAERLHREAVKAEKKAKKAAAAKKEKKSAEIGDDDEDVDMVDAIGEPDDSEMPEPSSSKTNANGKRVNEDGEPRPESKKIKIKMNATPKSTNGTSTPRAAKETPAAKSTTKKTKKTPKAAAAEAPEVAAPKEPELSPEEKRLKKEKEILFLRHKLQKGLLTRDQEPKEEEMKQMSEFVTKLEGYADLEVSIIRGTKINKVLKAILKLGTIPKEEEFKFKPRSQTLLDKWNKLLASDQGAIANAPATNGTATEAKLEEEEAKASPVNGTKESSADVRAEKVSTGDVPAPESKQDTEILASAPAEEEDETKQESVKEELAVESAA